MNREKGAPLFSLFHYTYTTTTTVREFSCCCVYVRYVSGPAGLRQLGTRYVLALR